MDSERGASSKAVGIPGVPPFYPEIMEDKRPQEYIAKIQEAAESKVEVLVIDSYSHSWIAALELVDKMSSGTSKFSSGWKVVSPLEQQLRDAILSYPGHVIATMRDKAEYVVEKDEKTGKSAPRKVGMAPVAREGTEYEFDVMLDLSPEGIVNVTKTRCPALVGEFFTRQDLPKLAQILKKWLEEGTPLSPVDELADKLRFCATLADLEKVKPEIAVLAPKLTDGDKVRLSSVYKARKAELTPHA
jgi:hypothetical protein